MGNSFLSARGKGEKKSVLWKKRKAPWHTQKDLIVLILLSHQYMGDAQNCNYLAKET